MLAPTIVKLLSEDKSFIAVMMNTRALTHRIDMISCSFARTTSLVTSSAFTVTFTITVTMCLCIKAFASCVTCIYQCFAKPNCHSQVSDSICRATMVVSEVALFGMVGLLIWEIYSLIESSTGL
jgi:hypothetical protein